MMFKSRLTTLVSALLVAGSALASHGKPAACPSVESIKAEGITMASEIFDGAYLDYNSSLYDTDTQWFFIMGPVLADSEDAAIVEGNKLLATASGPASPEEDEEGEWVCEYSSDNSELGMFAVHVDQTPSPMAMSRFLKRKH